MTAGNEIKVGIHLMSEQASGPDDGKRPVSVFGWIGKATKGVGSACFNTLTGPAAGPLIFAGICAALVYGAKRRARNRIALHRSVSIPALHRSVSIAALHGGDMTLERIQDAQVARVDREALSSAAADMRKELDKGPKEISYKELHRLAARLEMTGREDEAIEMLQKKVNEAEKNNQPHEAHELQMLLVEMLIYKGDNEQALRCKCLEDEDISDARGHLYKAIIYFMMGDKENAKACYGKFQKIRCRFHWLDCLEGSPLYGVVHDFDKFGTAVENLKKEIEHAKTGKTG